MSLVGGASFKTPLNTDVLLLAARCAAARRRRATPLSAWRLGPAQNPLGRGLLSSAGGLKDDVPVIRFLRDEDHERRVYRDYVEGRITVEELMRSPSRFNRMIAFGAIWAVIWIVVLVLVWVGLR
jgi:hypothetical protein